MNDLNHLFELLAKNEMPNFLEVMAALSDVSNIWPEAGQADPRSSGSAQQTEGIPDYPCNPSRPSGACRL